MKIFSVYDLQEAWDASAQEARSPSSTNSCNLDSMATNSPQPTEYSLGTADAAIEQ